MLQRTRQVGTRRPGRDDEALPRLHLPPARPLAARVDAFTGKGIEEVGSVPDEERAVCHNSGGPRGEGSRDEDFANDTILRDSPAHPGEELELLLKESGGSALRLTRERSRNDQGDIGHAFAQSVESDVSRTTHMHLGHIAHSGDTGDMSDEGHP